MARKQTLEMIADQWLQERMHAPGLSLERVQTLRTYVVGDPVTEQSLLGFVLFLNLYRRKIATLHDFQADEVGLYWEFVAEHRGVRHANRAMGALQLFWKWCESTEQWRDNRETPPDFSAARDREFQYQVMLGVWEKESLPRQTK